MPTRLAPFHSCLGDLLANYLVLICTSMLYVINLLQEVVDFSDTSPGTKDVLVSHLAFCTGDVGSVPMS